MIFEILNGLSAWFFYISLFIGGLTIMLWFSTFAWLAWVNYVEKRREVFEGYIKRSKYLAMRMCCLSAIEYIDDAKIRRKLLEQERRAEGLADNEQ